MRYNEHKQIREDNMKTIITIIALLVCVMMSGCIGNICGCIGNIYILSESSLEKTSKHITGNLYVDNTCYDENTTIVYHLYCKSETSGFFTWTVDKIEYFNCYESEIINFPYSIKKICVIQKYSNKEDMLKYIESK